MTQDTKEIAKEDQSNFKQYRHHKFFSDNSSLRENRVKAIADAYDEMLTNLQTNYKIAIKNLDKHHNKIFGISKRLEKNKNDLIKINERENELKLKIQKNHKELEEIDAIFKNQFGINNDNYFRIFKAIREFSPIFRDLFLSDLENNRRAKDGKQKTFLYHAIGCENFEAALFFIENEIIIENSRELLEIMLDNQKDLILQQVRQKIINYKSTYNQKFIDYVRDNDYQKVYDMLNEKSVDINAVDENNTNALIHAIQVYDKYSCDTFKIMLLLINEGIDINQPDKDGFVYTDYLCTDDELMLKLETSCNLHRINM